MAWHDQGCGPSMTWQGKDIPEVINGCTSECWERRVTLYVDYIKVSEERKGQSVPGTNMRRTQSARAGMEAAS